MKIHLIAAARPNFMKIAPLYHVLKNKSAHDVKIIHTGQHYDKNMSESFFVELGLPVPDINLEIGGGSHAEQVGKTMIAYEEICLKQRPDLVVVVGDVNATMACSITAKKLGLQVAHLEAGIRSFDREMPEEINRLVTDSICDWYWTPSLDANENLVKEGVDPQKIKFVGNIMIDSLELMRKRITAQSMLEKLGIEKGKFAVATFHRPSNVDDKQKLSQLIDTLIKVSRDTPIVFPIHPRTKTNCEKFGLLEKLKDSNAILTDPMGYQSFMSLVLDCKFALTDSGGIQEETTYLGIPCLTVRSNTERPVTVLQGTNTLVEVEEIIGQVVLINSGDYKNGSVPELWDGKTASRVLAVIDNVLQPAKINEVAM
jgi:UDP-N-acetylglucosamine 2-epimerase (non-hydrolysing)